ncbi:MAG: hypothetical protein P8Y28_15005 [Gammaproteobacteria bacterium]
MLTGCGGGGSDTNYQPQVIEEKTDTVAPVLSISIPTANPAYTTNEGTVTIGGTVSDDTAVT